jgi:hypothetical protein
MDFWDYQYYFTIVTDAHVRFTVYKPLTKRLQEKIKGLAGKPANP